MAPKLGLDVGGVLTGLRGHREPGFDSLERGALALVSLHVISHGPQSVEIVSRVNKHVNEPAKAWVYKCLDLAGFFEVLGMNPSQLHLCSHVSGKHGKGPIAKDLCVTHFVDDREACLCSIHADKNGNASGTLVNGGIILFGSKQWRNNISSRAEFEPCGYDDRKTRELHVHIRNFEELAVHLGFSRQQYNDTIDLLT